MTSSSSNESWSTARLATASPSMLEAGAGEAPGLVYVVDDDVLIREALVNLLESSGLSVEAFADAHLFLDAQRRDTAACLVLDVGLPGLSGLELQDRLADTDRVVPIIFITGKGDIRMSVRAMRAGAITFLTKPFSAEELLEAIHQAVERDRTVRRDRHELTGIQSRYASLTRRERQVMAAVVSGLLNREIAAQLGTHLGTIKEQRGAVMRKMKASSLAELVRMAAQLRLPSSARAARPNGA
jgi:FixJ family two-component response regulator